MKTKNIIVVLASFVAFSAYAQIDKAASEAANAVEQRLEQKRAEDDAAKSGPVGKAVNDVKAEYHKKRAEHSEKEAKDALTPSNSTGEKVKDALSEKVDDIKDGAVDIKDKAKAKMAEHERKVEREKANERAEERREKLERDLKK